MQCWFWWSHGLGTQGHISAWHCTLLYQPISSSEANSGIPDTAVLHRRMDLDWHRVSSDPFKRERDRTIHKFLGTCGGKYHSDNHQRNQSYGERPSLLLVWLISLGKKDELSGQNPIVRSNTQACFEDRLWMRVHCWGFCVFSLLV